MCVYGFGVFASNYYNNQHDIRKSCVISKVNKYCQILYQQSWIWVGIRNIYSLNNIAVSYEELQKRIFTDYTNVSQHFQPSYFLDLNYIFMMHVYARIYYERQLWGPVGDLLAALKQSFKNYPKLCLPDSASQLIDIQKIDQWIEKNRKFFLLINELDFSFKGGISSLTIEISYFTGLRKIYLSGQNIKSLPIEMRSLVNLKHIALDKNKLDYFPIVLCYLISLKSINLSNNNIKYLPCQIKKMIELRKLTLFRNSISSVNNSLCSLKLNSLNLKRNPITRNDLPKNMLAKKITIDEPILEQKSDQIMPIKQLQIHIPKRLVQIELNLNQGVVMQSESRQESDYDGLMEGDEMLFLLKENHLHETSPNKRCNPFDENEEYLKRSKYS